MLYPFLLQEKHSIFILTVVSVKLNIEYIDKKIYNTKAGAKNCTPKKERQYDRNPESDKEVWSDCSRQQH